MQSEQVTVERSSPPFLIYPDPARELLRAHAATSDRDPIVAQILAVLPGHAYAHTTGREPARDGNLVHQDFHRNLRARRWPTTGRTNTSPLSGRREE